MQFALRRLAGYTLHLGSFAVNGVILRCAVTPASALVAVQLSEPARTAMCTLLLVPGRSASSFSQPRPPRVNVPELQRAPCISYLGFSGFIPMQVIHRMMSHTVLMAWEKIHMCAYVRTYSV